LMDTDLRIQGSTPGMDDRLRRLLPHPAGLPPVPAAALNTAAQLLAVEEGVDGHEPEARTHLGDGRWVAVRAARLRPSNAISVSACSRSFDGLSDGLLPASKIGADPCGQRRCPRGNATMPGSESCKASPKGTCSSARITVSRSQLRATASERCGRCRPRV
ncbi:MAG: hypothetical protein WCF12_05265, partial [Propionicimonas sp.]